MKLHNFITEDKMKIKHKCKECVKKSKRYADLSKRCFNYSKMYADISKKFADKCQCKKGKSR